MHRKPLVWKLFPIYFLITLISVLIIGLCASSFLRSFYYTQEERDLEVRTELIKQDLQERNSLDADQMLSSRIKTLAATSKTRITLVAPTGKVIADSKSNPAKMDNHSDRPEIRMALKEGIGRSRRTSPTLGITMVYLAVPIENGGHIHGILRVAMAATAFDNVPTAIYDRLAIGMALIAVLAGIASFLAARRISGPLKKMKNAAISFADGDFGSRVPSPDTEELASLADTLNRMASQLDKQVRTITQQAGEQQAILKSLREGVIAIDNDDRILILNSTAEQFLSLRYEALKGKTIQEAIRNPELQKFIEKAREDSSPTMDEITLHSNSARLVQLTGTALMDADGKRIGVLLVLNDVTQTRKLENLRRDFVANVSHELKTPITSIKGFVETLRDGAINDPEKAMDFLGIVARQSDRLNAIIEDLLTLSKIEQSDLAAEIPLVKSNVSDVLVAAVSNCSTKAANCNVNIAVQCPDDLEANLDPPLFEQAITNLVDNAVKYSPDGHVTISGSRKDNDVIIDVVDTGCGIEAEHIPRLFERFYRVDKARSRKLGGTGLGLAIVKYIVRLHSGRIEVKSVPGEGSTFTVVLPCNDRP